MLTVLGAGDAGVALTTLSIAAFGIWGTLGPFWAMPTALLRGTAAAGGIALVNSIGNVGGFVGPYLMGWIREATGGFTAGLLTLAGDPGARRGDRPVDSTATGKQLAIANGQCAIAIRNWTFHYMKLQLCIGH